MAQPHLVTNGPMGPGGAQAPSRLDLDVDTWVEARGVQTQAPEWSVNMVW